LSEKEAHYFVLSPENDQFYLPVSFWIKAPEGSGQTSQQVFEASSRYWQSFWQRGGAIDFSPVVRMNGPANWNAVFNSFPTPDGHSIGRDVSPQETGLTFNSWFREVPSGDALVACGTFRAMEPGRFAGREVWTVLRDRLSGGKVIAERQGFKGARWMKMTDPSGTEAPSKVGSFLIWQQPHFIYMAELIYRSNPTAEVLKKYGFLVEETAEFMASFATYDDLEGRYVLKGIIPARETLRASETINPPFELSYWHYASSVAQQWREACRDKNVNRNGTN
jgi:hypothetical protein